MEKETEAGSSLNISEMEKETEAGSSLNISEMEKETEAGSSLNISEMEKETEAGSSLNISESRLKNQVMVSRSMENTTLFKYVNLAKRHLKEHNQVELCGLGKAIGTVATVSEILKNQGVAVEKSVETSTVSVNAKDGKGKPTKKSQMVIVLGKSEQFDEIMTAAAEKREAAAKLDKTFSEFRL